MKSREELIFAYLQDSASPSELEQLFSWINDDPNNAIEFARIASMQGHLRSQLRGESEVRDSGEELVDRLEVLRPLASQHKGRRPRAPIRLPREQNSSLPWYVIGSIIMLGAGLAILFLFWLYANQQSSALQSSDPGKLIQSCKCPTSVGPVESRSAPSCDQCECSLNPENGMAGLPDDDPNFVCFCRHRTISSCDPLSWWTA